MASREAVAKRRSIAMARINEQAARVGALVGKDLARTGVKPKDKDLRHVTDLEYLVDVLDHILTGVQSGDLTIVHGPVGEGEALMARGVEEPKAGLVQEEVQESGMEAPDQSQLADASPDQEQTAAERGRVQAEDAARLQPAASKRPQSRRSR